MPDQKNSTRLTERELADIIQAELGRPEATSGAALCPRCESAFASNDTKGQNAQDDG